MLSNNGFNSRQAGTEYLCSLDEEIEGLEEEMKTVKTRLVAVEQ